MSRLRAQITISLDGFVAGPRQRLEEPLGEGGRALHGWAFATRSFRAQHGLGDDGATGVDDDRIAAAQAGIGATIMGRNMFGPVRGPWDAAEPWRGWWGEEPPYHHPAFVLTHHPRPPLVLAGGTTFHFVTDGIEAALSRARAAADGRDVAIGGGADTLRQYLRAGHVDELELHVVPVLLGAGERLLDGLADAGVGFEQLDAVAGEAATHLRYRPLIRTDR